VEVQPEFTELPHLTAEFVELPAIDRLVASPYRDHPIALIASDGSAAEEPLAGLMSAQGWEVRRLHLGTADVNQAIDNAPHLDACLVLLDGADGYSRSVRALADAVLLAGAVTKPLLASAKEGSRAAFLTLSRLDGQLGHLGAASDAVAVTGGATGLVKTLVRESPQLFCRAIDIAPDIDAGSAAAAVLAELTDPAVDLAEVGIADGGRRRAPRWRPAAKTDESAGLDETDTVLVTGGARGVTAACVTELARRVHCGFLLLGRTELDEEPEWAHGKTDGELTAVLHRRLRDKGENPSPMAVERQTARLLAQREIRATLAAVRDAGGRAEYLAVDITDADATQRALRGREVTAFVHGAGAVADSLLPGKTAAEAATVFGPKLDGLRTVLDVLDADSLRHIVLFGSIAGVLGNPGQADYASANEALGALAARTPRTSVIHWGAWDGGMVTPALAESFTARGVRLIPLAMGAQAFADHLTSDRPTAVLIGDAEPLGGSIPPRRPVSVRSRRDLRGLAADPVIGDHRIGEHPVLPVAAALGWMAQAVERANPGHLVVTCEQLEVCRGVVFDETAPDELDLVAAVRPDEPTVVDVVVNPVSDGRVTPHFRATLRLASDPAQPGWANTEPQGPGAEPGSLIYDRATLFHGPLLQGIRWLRRDGDRRALAGCEIPDTPLAAGAYAGKLHSPVLADVVLQPAVVVATGLLGESCLPLSAGRIDYFAPIPGGAEFLVLVDDARVSESGVVLTATACDPGGRILQRFADVTMVATPDLAAKFAASVEARLGQVTR
jgi:NAD(P)-dependent dehydrogenase (short-subunit alcohol dehydrogenase family)